MSLVINGNQSTFSHTLCLRKEGNVNKPLSCHPYLHQEGEGQKGTEKHKKTKTPPKRVMQIPVSPLI